MICNQKSHRMRSPRAKMREWPPPAAEKSPRSNYDPAQPKINKYCFSKKQWRKPGERETCIVC